MQKNKMKENEYIKLKTENEMDMVIIKNKIQTLKTKRDTTILNPTHSQTITHLTLFKVQLII